MKDLRRGVLFAAQRLWWSVLVIEVLAMGFIYFRSSGASINWVLLKTVAFWLFLLLGVMAFLVFFRSYRIKQKSPALQGIIHYEFDESGMKTTSVYSSTEIRWPAVIKWRENSTTFLVYATPHFANVIPKRFFSSAEDVAAVQNLLRTHANTKKK